MSESMPLTPKRLEMLELVERRVVSTERTVRWVCNGQAVRGADGRTLRELHARGLITTQGALGPGELTDVLLSERGVAYLDSARRERALPE